MNAEITPNASPIPNVLTGGNGERTFARKAATVVITARDNATDNFSIAIIHASAGV